MACSTLVDDYLQGRMSEWLVFCGTVSTSWQRLKDMGAEGATFGPVIRWKRKKSPGERAAFLVFFLPCYVLDEGAPTPQQIFLHNNSYSRTLLSP